MFANIEEVAGPALATVLVLGFALAETHARMPGA